MKYRSPRAAGKFAPLGKLRQAVPQMVLLDNKRRFAPSGFIASRIGGLHIQLVAAGREISDGDFAGDWHDAGFCSAARSNRPQTRVELEFTSLCVRKFELNLGIAH